MCLEVMTKSGVAKKFFHGVTMFVVTALSLSLLLYVAYNEGKRGFEQIHLEKLTSQGRLVQDSINKYVGQDLPLKQYAGFATLVTPLVEGGEIDAMTVYDTKGRKVFDVVSKSQPKLPPLPASATKAREKIEIDNGETHYQIMLPLRTRFEMVGTIVIAAPNQLVTAHMHERFFALPFIALALSIAFAVIIAMSNDRLVKLKWPWLQIGYAATFVLMAGFVIFTLVSLYFNAEKGKAQASAVQMSQRLTDVVRFNIEFKDISGLDRALADFRKLNSEISEAAVIVDKSVQIGTNHDRLGKGWVSDPANFEYMVTIGDSKVRTTSLAVTVPRDVVFERVARSVKNFAALFIAAALMSGLFLQVASALQGNRKSTAAEEAKPDLKSDTALVIVKPIFFLAIFLDSMTYSFLPKFMQEAAVASGVSLGWASLPFTAYYLAFALSLIPAGTYADRRGPRPLIIWGLVIAGLSVLGFALPLGIWGMTALRGLSGVGQGILFIGVQAYILAVTPPEKKTQGAAVIVLGFQGGMIAGMAIGSLMVNFLQTRGVFVLSAAVALAVTGYTVWLMPKLVPAEQPNTSVWGAVGKLGHDLKRVVGSGEFLNAIFCIGIPAKAILTGTITFALPLLLGQLKYRQEDIGQIIMLYGLGVIAATGYVARLVDRKGNTDAILFWGAAMSGIGLVMVSLMGTNVLGSMNITISVVIIGVIMVGIAHGFINAPVITHMAQSDIADRIGANPVTTTYRFLERLGHVAGPFLVSQAFLLWGQTPEIVTGIGFAAAILGILFLARKFIPTRPFSRSGEAVQ